MSKTTKTSAASTVEFEQAVKELEKLCGKRRRPLKQAKGGFAFHLDPARARSFKLDQVYAEFLKRGCYVFDTDPAREKTRIAILPTADKYQAIAAMRTAGPNWGRETKHIISWLRRLERTQPFIITGISEEHVSGRFTSKLRHIDDLAMTILEFSPDLGDPDGIAEELRKSGGFWLWWT